MKRICGLLSLFIILIIGLFVLTPRKTIIKTKTNNYNVYVEEDGDYVLSDSNKLSSKGYVLNTNQSSCTSGSTISQDSNTGVVSVTTTKADKCNFYFQKASDLTLNKLHTLNNDIELKQVSGYPKLGSSSPQATGKHDGGFGSRKRTNTINDPDKYITYSTTYNLDLSNGHYNLVSPQTCKWSDCYSVFSSGTYYTAYDNLRDAEYNPSWTSQIYLIDNNSNQNELITHSSRGVKTGRFAETNFSPVEYSRGASVNNYLTCAESYTFNEYGGYYVLNNPHPCKWSDYYLLAQDPNNSIYTCHPYVLADASSYIYDPEDSELYKLSTNSTSNRMYYYRMNNTDILDYDEDDVGLFSLEDDYGLSYFFRGKILNNYFKFGKNSSNQDMYWRILRINGDGSIRLVYDGTVAHDFWETAEDRSVGKSTYNDYSDDAAYLGYMYGNFSGNSTSYEQATKNEVSSTLKIYLENWYTNNIENTGYNQYVSDEIFCNDRSIKSGLGYGQNETEYNGYRRDKPIFKCPQKNDAFTVNDSFNGNAALSKPVGFLSYDERNAAGNSWKYYLFKGTDFYNNGTEASGAAREQHILTAGHIYFSGTNLWVTFRYSDSGGTKPTGNEYVVPVINIKREYVNNIQGNGTKNNPFYIGT